MATDIDNFEPEEEEEEEEEETTTTTAPPATSKAPDVTQLLVASPLTLPPSADALTTRSAADEMPFDVSSNSSSGSSSSSISHLHHHHHHHRAPSSMMSSAYGANFGQDLGADGRDSGLAEESQLRGEDISEAERNFQHFPSTKHLPKQVRI